MIHLMKYDEALPVALDALEKCKALNAEVNSLEDFLAEYEKSSKK